LVHRESSSANQTTGAAANVGSAARERVRRRSGFVQVGQCLQIQSTWTKNVSTLSELLRKNSRVQWSEVGAEQVG
jgi:hypothetical protein